MASEKRLIDANALKQMFDEREADDIELYGCHIVECFPADDAKEIVDNAPTVDAVEVVRCKDCKHLYSGMDDYCCKSHRGLVRICEDSFCSYGERKGNEK